MLAQLFEIDRTGRSQAMEGLRGIAVGLVFLQHYCTQFLVYGHLSGSTEAFAKIFRYFGNYGVELFFVLSGYLIYGILLRRRPAFIQFMVRRAQRLYPAFFVALVIGAAIDFLRPIPKIPAGFDGLSYIAANVVFLPGLFPIEPLFAVNWSLSYEWWFYTTATLLFSVAGLALLPKAARIALILALSLILVGLSAFGVPNVPVRGLPLFAGMLLAEERDRMPSAVAIPLAAFCLLGTALSVASWLTLILLSVGFYALCVSSLSNGSLVARSLSWRYLRWFGNMSYSYYLVHGFVVLFCLHALFRVFGSNDGLFWVFLVPVFAFTICGGALLFLFVEKPYSLREGVGKIDTRRLAA